MVRSQGLKLLLILGLFALPVAGFAQSAGGLPKSDPPVVYVGSIGSPSVSYASVRDELLSSPSDQMMYGVMTAITFLSLGLIPLIQMVRIALGVSDKRETRAVEQQETEIREEPPRAA